MCARFGLSGRGQTFFGRLHLPDSYIKKAPGIGGLPLLLCCRKGRGMQGDGFAASCRARQASYKNSPLSEASTGIMAPAKKSGGWSMVCCERMIKRKQGTYKKPPFEVAHCFAGGKYFRAVFVALWQPEQLCCTIILCICNHFHHIIHNYIVYSSNSPPLLQAFRPFSGHSAQ